MRPTLEPDSFASPRTRYGPERSSALDEVRCALISAVYHAHRNNLHEGAPPFLTPMPLDRMVAVLEGSGNDLLGVLAACWLLDNPKRAEKLKPYAARLIERERIEQLDFDEELTGSVSFTARPDIEAAKISQTRFSYAIPQTRFAYACEKLLGNTPRCAPTDHWLAVWFDPHTLVTDIEASVVVQRDPDAYRQHADPRGWERNAALFFKKSERCDEVAGDFQTRPNPPVIGNADYDGLLLEHVSLGTAPGFPIDSINVLNVSCGSQKATPQFDVSLHTCLEMQLWLSWSRGGLDVDSGVFETTAVAGSTQRTRLRGTKMARFTEREVLGQPIGRLVNYFAPFCLAALMSTLIFGGACYDPV
jgi:hypothetical protein